MRQHPFAAGQLADLAERFGTPLYLYDAAGLRTAARSLNEAFAWAPGFRNYFAVKATPNPHILRLLAEAGCGMDCSSLPELLLAERAGCSGEQIFFSSNTTPHQEFAHAAALGALINLDAHELLPYLVQHVGAPQTLCFRYNPGPLRQGNAIIGRPEEAKFGLTRDQLFVAYAQARDLGVTRFGLHTMVASNELDPGYIVASATMLFELAGELHNRLGIAIDFVNCGGGIGIPYRPEQQAVDLAAVSAGVRAAYEELVLAAGLPPLRIFFECGRLIAGPHGYLLSRVRHVKQTYKRYVGLDATMANLMRPGMYGAYHHISVVGREREEAAAPVDVTGSLCENNDKFAIDRALPALAPGDLVLIHDAGAHGHAMGFNYNGKLRSAEVLIHEDGAAQLIRRAETIDDYFATLVC